MGRLYTVKTKRLLGATTRTIQCWDRGVRVVRTVGGCRRIPGSGVRRILGLKEERTVLGYVRLPNAEG